ncbi:MULTISPECIES: hypothetical protein [Pseudomonas]|uniref:hypothetical protein n=1 Tax=Pseudomonas TaxID=286 RepID=UPI0018E72ACA|nr:MULTISPECIES: hypothetical protein [Pseudomonas]MBJ2204595.1 hypothetical protein [Pseudomonas carnis]MBJ2303169.1 hypothetical protein [Pseudomonas sp. MF2846]MBK3488282.1 hypothetical protein [Pseudomonas sp. MF2857]
MTSPIESTTGIPVVTATTAEVVAGPWPNYSNCRHLPERDRWEVYGLAKAGRAALEDRGIVIDEPYDQFIARVTRELGL